MSIILVHTKRNLNLFQSSYQFFTVFGDVLDFAPAVPGSLHHHTLLVYAVRQTEWLHGHCFLGKTKVIRRRKRLAFKWCSSVRVTRITVEEDTTF